MCFCKKKWYKYPPPPPPPPTPHPTPAPPPPLQLTVATILPLFQIGYSRTNFSSICTAAQLSGASTLNWKSLQRMKFSTCSWLIPHVRISERVAYHGGTNTFSRRRGGCRGGVHRTTRRESITRKRKSHPRCGKAKLRNLIGLVRLNLLRTIGTT